MRIVLPDSRAAVRPGQVLREAVGRRKENRGPRSDGAYSFLIPVSLFPCKSCAENHAFLFATCPRKEQIQQARDAYDWL